jgi:DNA repair protein RAD50
LDAKIADSQAPIEKLESEYQQAQREITDKIAEAQRASQDLNITVDKLESINKAIERYDNSHPNSSGRDYRLS